MKNAFPSFFEGGASRKWKEAPGRRIRGIVKRAESNYLWIQEGKRNPVRVAVDNGGAFEIGDAVAFTPKGAHAVDRTPGYSVLFGEAQKIDLSSFMPARTEAPDPRKENWFKMTNEEIDKLVTDLRQTDAIESQALEEESEPEPLPSEEVEEQIERPVREHEVGFLKEKGKFFVLSQGKEHKIVNAFSEYLIPGDTVEVELLPNEEARVLRVAYAKPRTVAGRIEKDNRTGEYIFAPRIPARPPGRTLNKIKMPIGDIFFTEEEAAEAEQKGIIILFNREEEHRGALTLPKTFDNNSKAERWMTLVNLGVRAYDPETLAQEEKDKEAVKELGRAYGVTDIEDEDKDKDKDRDSIDDVIEPVLKDMAQKEIDAGAVEDWRGRGITIGIDPEGSRDHDDVFTLERLHKDEKGNEHYRVAVHIADASRFITAGGELDERALRLATSIYTDDDTIRMLPSLISEHLGSLKEGRTRFALSLVADIAWDAKKKVRINSMRLVPTVIEVTKNATYKEAQQAIDAKGRGDEVTKTIYTLFNIHRALDARIGIRQPYDDPTEKPDAISMVELYNGLKNRFAGVMLDRLTRSTTQPRMRAVQDAITSIYRFNEPTKENQEWFKEELKRLGVLSEEDLATPKGTPRDFETIVRRSREKIEDMPQDVVEQYYRISMRTMRRGSTGYTVQKKGHFAMGEARIAHTSSPLRRVTDLMNQRVEKFLLKLEGIRKSKKGEDITEQEERELLLSYAKDVFGIDLSEDAASRTNEELRELVYDRTQERTALALSHMQERVQLARRAEEATGALSAAERIAGAAKREPIVLSPPYGLSITLPPGEVIKRRERLARSGGSRRRGTEMIYGQITLSRKHNRHLASVHLSERSLQRGVTLQVAFELPSSMEDPVAYTDAKKMKRCEFNLAGKITGAEISKGRIIFSVNQTAGYLETRRKPPSRKGGKSS